jgi:hypothetical protein
MKFLILLLLTITSAYGERNFADTVKPFIKKYCVNCHGPKKQKSNLRLDTLPTILNELSVASEWQHVLNEMNAAAMPPEDEKQPTAKELSEVLEVLTYRIEDAKKKLYGKDRNIVMRRLNRREYINTIEELTGVRLEEKQVLDDAKTAGFDTEGKGLLMSGYRLENYLKMGQYVLDRAIYKEKPKTISKNIHNPGKVNHLLKRRLDKMKVEIKKGANKKAALAMLESYLGNKETEKYVFASPFFRVGGLGATFTGYQAFFPYYKGFTPGIYKYSITLGTGDVKPGDRVMIHVYPHVGDRSVKQVFDLFEVTKDYKTPQTIDVEFYLKEKTVIKIEPRIQRLGKNKPFIAIEKIQLTGPVYKQWPPASHKKIFPVAQGNMSDKIYADKIIKAFALKAFKGRKATPKFLNSILEIFLTNRSSGMSLEDAIKEPLAIILSSPKFLFTVEEQTKAVNGRQLAERLSYFLWSSRPDKELYSLADTKKLKNPSVLKAQVKRMLKDPKSLSLAKGFVPQWLEFHKLDIVDVNRKVFLKYDDHVKRSVRQEPIHFFHTVAQHNLSLENFIDSNFIVVDNVMKQFYGLPSNGKDDFEPIKIAPNSGRGGLLGQAAVLIMTGNGERTSPVMRGAFVMSKMLGMPSPEPPPNVPQLKTNRKSSSIREALKVHQKQPQCSSCHKRIDPAGFSLEIFDASGLMKSSSKDKIYTKGHFPGGHTFSNIHEMKKLLRERKDTFAKSVIEELMSYALGRVLGFSDAKAVDQLLEESKKSQYKLGDLIAEIILSPEFNMK